MIIYNTEYLFYTARSFTIYSFIHLIQLEAICSFTGKTVFRFYYYCHFCADKSEFDFWKIVFEQTP